MYTINWGIIGCGNVTEVKSGPAFNKVPGSKLVAVMRRNAEKAADYALRHQVENWYDDAAKLINDPMVNAVYIATPPSSHMEYAIAVIDSGKSVYLEKPMTIDFATSNLIVKAAEAAKTKLTIAHYRRCWPLFLKLKSLLNQQTIGDIHLIKLHLYKTPPTAAELIDEKMIWRFNPYISGGGLFHDLAPHQLDIMYFLFGKASHVTGFATNRGGHYLADDTVSGNILFANEIVFNGTWCFSAPISEDECEIIGSTGTIRFSFFSGNYLLIFQNGQTTRLEFDLLQHVQQPMIAETVKYFAGGDINPCSGEEGGEVMRWIEEITKK